MSPTTAGLLGLAGLFVLLALRMPVGIAMMLVGVLGFGTLNGWGPAMAVLGSEPFVIATNYELIVIPLFVLMGNFATVSGMSRDLYAAAYAWFSVHWRGGLASATIAACAGFAALSGSSVAAAVTMGKVALPEMRTYRYDSRLSTGAIAAGGTLGILIPPSTGFVIYAILTEESIGRLFLAGFLPGAAADRAVHPVHLHPDPHQPGPGAARAGFHRHGPHPRLPPGQRHDRRGDGDHRRHLRGALSPPPRPPAWAHSWRLCWR